MEKEKSEELKQTFDINILFQQLLKNSSGCGIEPRVIQKYINQVESIRKKKLWMRKEKNKDA